jgi:ABC-type multidrug transport system ATPase subunit
MIFMLNQPTPGIGSNGLDGVWEFLIDLSREQGVTILILTSPVNDGSRYDHISSADSGRILTPDAATDLVRAGESTFLEDMFIRLGKTRADLLSTYSDSSSSTGRCIKEIKLECFSLGCMQRAMKSLRVALWSRARIIWRFCPLI